MAGAHGDIILRGFWLALLTLGFFMLMAWSAHEARADDLVGGLTQALEPVAEDAVPAVPVAELVEPLLEPVAEDAVPAEPVAEVVVPVVEVVAPSVPSIPEPVSDAILTPPAPATPPMPAPPPAPAPPPDAPNPLVEPAMPSAPFRAPSATATSMSDGGSAPAGSSMQVAAVLTDDVTLAAIVVVGLLALVHAAVRTRADGTLAWPG